MPLDDLLKTFYNHFMKKKLPAEKFKLSLPLKIFLFLASIIIILLFFLKSWFVVAVVNKTPITRFYLDRELERQGGKQVLESRITEILINQEAQRQKITVGQDEIKQKIDQIDEQLKPQGQSVDALLAMQGQTRKDLEEQLRLQLLIEKILGKDIKIADQEITDYFEKNKSAYAEETKLEDKKEEIQKILLNQKMSEKFQPWLEDLKNKAKIYYFLKL